MKVRAWIFAIGICGLFWTADAAGQVARKSPHRSPAGVAPDPEHTPVSKASARPLDAQSKLPWVCGEEERAMLEALDKPLEVDYVDTPLRDVIDDLNRKTGIKIVLEADDNIESQQTNMQVTKSLKASRARSVLDLILRPLKLDWDIRDDTLWISGADTVARLQKTKVYDVSDLSLDPDAAVDAISSTVAPESWAESGGAGRVAVLSNIGGGNLLVVRQNRQGHEELAQLLNDLRAVNKKNGQTAPQPEKEDKPEKLAPSTTQRQLSQTDQSSPAVDDDIAKGLNRFGFDLLRETTSLDGDYQVVSPYCVSSALGMALVSAQGTTAQELADLLHTPDPASFAGDFNGLRAKLKLEAPETASLMFANRLWLDQSLPPVEETRQLLATKFGADLGQVDFAKNLGGAKGDIAKWIAEHTAGKLDGREMVDSLKPDTRLALTSALYFNAKWDQPFKRDNTERKPFHSFARRVTVPLMQITEQCKYAETENVQIAEKPYKGGRFTMTLILPRRGKPAFEKLMRTLNPETIDRWLAAASEQKIDLDLPRFETRLQTDLTSPLKKLGLATAFDPNAADFSGLARVAFLQTVAHGVYIRVDEQGTEAAAVTGGFGGGAQHFVPPRPHFQADRPFVFLVRDRTTGAVLLLGAVLEPTNNIANGDEAPSAASPKRKGEGSQF